MIPLKQRIETTIPVVNESAKIILTQLLEFGQKGVSDKTLSSLIIEKLSSIELDSVAASFLKREKKLAYLNSLHLIEAVNELKESRVFDNNITASYTLKPIMSLIEEQANTSAFAFIYSLLEKLETFIYDPVIKNVYNNVYKTYEHNVQEISCLNTITQIHAANEHIFYEKEVNMIESLIFNPNNEKRKELIGILENHHNYHFRNLASILRKIAPKNSLDLIAENNKTTVYTPASYIHVNEQDIYFAIAGKIYKKTDDKIEILDESLYNTLPYNFLTKNSFMQTFPTASFVNEKFKVYFNGDKFEILNRGDKTILIVNEQEVESSEVFFDTYIKMNQLGEANMNVAYTLNAIWESFKNIVELDFCKVLTSKINEQTYCVLFNDSDKISLAVTDTFNKLVLHENVTNLFAKQLVLETLSYDLSESLGNMLKHEEQELFFLRQQKQELYDNIEKFKATQNKIDIALSETNNETIFNELSELKEGIQNEIEIAESQFSKITASIRVIENNSAPSSKKN